MTPIPQLVKALKEHFPMKIRGSNVVGVALHVYNFDQERVSIYVHTADPERKACGQGKSPEEAIADLEKHLDR